jgi:hypothetical protein
LNLGNSGDDAESIEFQMMVKLGKVANKYLKKASVSVCESLADRSSSFLPRRKSLFFLVSLLLMVE